MNLSFDSHCFTIKKIAATRLRLNLGKAENSSSAKHQGEMSMDGCMGGWSSFELKVSTSIASVFLATLGVKLPEGAPVQEA
jgi:hypothetical protein